MRDWYEMSASLYHPKSWIDISPKLPRELISILYRLERMINRSIMILPISLSNYTLLFIEHCGSFFFFLCTGIFDYIFPQEMKFPRVLNKKIKLVWNKIELTSGLHWRIVSSIAQQRNGQKRRDSAEDQPTWLVCVRCERRMRNETFRDCWKITVNLCAEVRESFYIIFFFFSYRLHYETHG